MVISSPKHKILGRRIYSPFTCVLSICKNVFCKGMVVLLNPVCVLLSVESFMFIKATELRSFLPNSKSFRPNSKSCRPDQKQLARSFLYVLKNNKRLS